MNDVIVVAVSYYYGGRGWTDPYTNIDFKADQKGLPIVISKDKDLTGIKRSVRLNNLLLLEGELDTSGENNLEKIDPAELTAEQLQEIAGESGADAEELQAQIDKLTKEKQALEKSNQTLTSEKQALEKSNQTLTSEKEAKDKKIKELEAQIATLTSQLEKANQAKATAESKLSTEEKSHKKTKDKMFAIHEFTEEELADSYFTVAILKEIMTTKSIAFEGGDNKSQLIEKLVAGQKKE